MLKYGPLFNESVKMFEAKQYKPAMESFKTLLSLLQDERRKDESMICQTLAYIEKMEPKKKSLPLPKKPTPVLEEKTEEYLDRLDEKANHHFGNNEYQAAIDVYQAVAKTIQIYHPKKRTHLAETYWNEAMAHSALFQILRTDDPKRASEHQAEVKRLVELARDTYPKHLKGYIDSCENFLSTIFPVATKSEQHSVEEASSYAVSEEAGEELDHAFAAIREINEKQLPLEPQYDLALDHIEKVSKLLATKKTLSPADKDYQFYCSSMSQQICHYFDTFGRAQKENVSPDKSKHVLLRESKLKNFQP